MSGKKDDIIEKTYNEFYGSITNTLRDARKIDPSIKYLDVKDFTRKTNLKGYNSYIANFPHEEYQIDLFFINDLEDQEFKNRFINCELHAYLCPLAHDFRPF